MLLSFKVIIQTCMSTVAKRCLYTFFLIWRNLSFHLHLPHRLLQFKLTVTARMLCGYVLFAPHIQLPPISLEVPVHSCLYSGISLTTV